MTALAQMGTWQPIETAPRYTPVLVIGPNIIDKLEMAVAELREYGWRACGVSGYEFDFDITPAHWMPLPVPPASSEVEAS